MVSCMTMVDTSSCVIKTTIRREYPSRHSIGAIQARRPQPQTGAADHTPASSAANARTDEGASVTASTSIEAGWNVDHTGTNLNDVFT